MRHNLLRRKKKTKMLGKWPTVTQESPEVQIIPLWAFYSTWLGAHKVWHATFKSLPVRPGLLPVLLRWDWEEVHVYEVWCDHHRPLRPSVHQFSLYGKLKGWALEGDSCGKCWDSILTLRDHFIKPFWEINVLYATKIILKTFEKNLKEILHSV